MSSVPTYTGATRPTSPSAGDAIYLSDVNRLAIYDGDISDWRLFNSDGVVYNAAAPNELHYTGGIYDSPSASYYLETAPIYHLDASIINGQDGSGNPANSSAIPAWVDRVNLVSGTQATASKQALYVPSDSSANNKAGVRFDGTDFYSLDSSLSPASVTYIVVTKSDPTITYSVGLSGSQFQASYWFKYTNNSDYVFGASKGNFTTQAQLEAPNIYIVTRAGTATEFRINGGAALWSGTQVGAVTVSKLGYNHLNYHTGVIYEIVLCDQELTDSDLDTTISYLGNKYGITTSAVS